MNGLRNAVVVFLFTILLTSCVTPAKRAQAYPEAFAQLSEAQQALVLRGQVDVGMSEEAVIIALGEPAYEKEGMFEGETLNGWVYQTAHLETIPRYRPSSYIDGNGNVTVVEQYDPIYRHEWKPSRIIYFRDGVLVGWQDL